MKLIHHQALHVSALVYALHLMAFYDTCYDLSSQVVMCGAGGSQGSRGPALAADTWLLVLHPRLTTTRSLERFRNQVGSSSVYMLVLIQA